MLRTWYEKSLIATTSSFQKYNKHESILKTWFVILELSKRQSDLILLLEQDKKKKTDKNAITLHWWRLKIITSWSLIRKFTSTRQFITQLIFCWFIFPIFFYQIIRKTIFHIRILSSNNQSKLIAFIHFSEMIVNQSIASMKWLNRSEWPWWVTSKMVVNQLQTTHKIKLNSSNYTTHCQLEGQLRPRQITPWIILITPILTNDSRLHNNWIYIFILVIVVLRCCHSVCKVVSSLIKTIKQQNKSNITQNGEKSPERMTSNTRLVWKTSIN